MTPTTMGRTTLTKTDDEDDDGKDEKALVVAEADDDKRVAPIETDGDEDACKPMRQFALSICPDDWYNKWDEEREEGTFSGIKFSA